MPAIGNRDEIVALIGYSSFEILIKNRGGQRLNVPSRMEHGSVLENWIGTEKAKVLIDQFGGFSIDIPTGRRVAPPSRQALIEAYILAGWPDSQIAEKVECTERAIRSSRKRMRECGKQLPGGNKSSSR